MSMQTPTGDEGLRPEDDNNPGGSDPLEALFGQLTEGKGRLAQGLRGISEELDRMLEGVSGQDQGMASALLRQVSDGARGLGERIESSQPQALLDDVQGLVRRNPAGALAAVAGVGMLISRMAQGAARPQDAPAPEQDKDKPAEQTPAVEDRAAAAETPQAATLERAKGDDVSSDALSPEPKRSHRAAAAGLAGAGLAGAAAGAALAHGGEKADETEAKKAADETEYVAPEGGEYLEPARPAESAREDAGWAEPAASLADEDEDKRQPTEPGTGSRTPWAAQHDEGPSEIYYPGQPDETPGADQVLPTRGARLEDQDASREQRFQQPEPRPATLPMREAQQQADSEGLSPREHNLPQRGAQPAEAGYEQQQPGYEQSPFETSPAMGASQQPQGDPRFGHPQAHEEASEQRPEEPASEQRGYPGEMPGQGWMTQEPQQQGWGPQGGEEQQHQGWPATDRGQAHEEPQQQGWGPQGGEEQQHQGWPATDRGQGGWPARDRDDQARQGWPQAQPQGGEEQNRQQGWSGYGEQAWGYGDQGRQGYPDQQQQQPQPEHEPRKGGLFGRLMGRGGAEMGEPALDDQPRTQLPNRQQPADPYDVEYPQRDDQPRN